MKAYKGFNKDMTCRGFQFEEGKTYEEPDAKLCEKGFHACEDPLNVMDYYSPADGSIYRKVELDEVSEDRSNDSKIVAKKITIGAEIGIPGLVKAHIKRISQTVKKDAAKIGSSGDAAQIECSADNAVIVCAGKRGRIKAPIGTWITLAEYGEYDGVGFPCKCVKSAIVDEETIKADTWYTLRNGEFVEVKE